MTTMILVLLVLMLIAGALVAYGVHHRRSRAGGILGVDRPGGTTPGGKP